MHVMISQVILRLGYGQDSSARRWITRCWWGMQLMLFVPFRYTPIHTIYVVEMITTTVQFYLAQTLEFTEHLQSQVHNAIRSLDVVISDVVNGITIIIYLDEVLKHVFGGLLLILVRNACVIQGGGSGPSDTPTVDTAEQVYISSLALLKVSTPHRIDTGQFVSVYSQNSCKQADLKILKKQLFVFIVQCYSIMSIMTSKYMILLNYVC